MKRIGLALLITGCAHPACHTMVEQSPPQVEVIEKVIVIHERPVHAALLSDYAQTLRAEQPVVLHSKAPVINQIIKLDAAARTALAPIERPGHHASQSEINQAVAAVGAVQAYVQQKH